MNILFLFGSVFSYYVYIKHFKSDLYVCDTMHHDFNTDIPEPCESDMATVYNVIPFNNFDVMIIDAHTGKSFNVTCGDKLNLFLYTGYENQVFTLKTVEENVFAISNNGKCIEPNIHGHGYDYVPCDGSFNQMFVFQHIDNYVDLAHSYNTLCNVLHPHYLEHGNSGLSHLLHHGFGHSLGSCSGGSYSDNSSHLGCKNGKCSHGSKDFSGNWNGDLHSHLAYKHISAHASKHAGGIMHSHGY